MLLIISVISILFIFSCGSQENKKIIVIKGCDNISQVLQWVEEDFELKNSEIDLKIIGGGTSRGISAFLDNATDIFLTSREFSHEESDKIISAGLKTTMEDFLCGKDQIVFIINKKNPFDADTANQIEGEIYWDQLEKIYLGSYTSWLLTPPQSGQEDYFSYEDDPDIFVYDNKISVTCPNSSNGSYEIIRKKLLRNRAYDKSVKWYENDNLIMDFVKSNKYAIGFISSINLNTDVNHLKVVLNPSMFALGITDPNSLLERELHIIFVRNYIEKTDKKEKQPINSPDTTVEVRMLKSEVELFKKYLMSEDAKKIISLKNRFH